MYYLAQTHHTPKEIPALSLPMPDSVNGSTIHMCSQDRYLSTIFNSTFASYFPHLINHYKVLSSLPLTLKPVLFSPTPIITIRNHLFLWITTDL